MVFSSLVSNDETQHRRAVTCGSLVFRKPHFCLPCHRRDRQTALYTGNVQLFKTRLAGVLQLLAVVCSRFLGVNVPLVEKMLCLTWLSFAYYTVAVPVRRRSRTPPLRAECIGCTAAYSVTRQLVCTSPTQQQLQHSSSSSSILAS